MDSGDILKQGSRLKSILDEIDSGDALPEAQIVCNIVDKLHKNLCITAYLDWLFLRATEEERQEEVITKESYRLSSNLKIALAMTSDLLQEFSRLDSGEESSRYDADNDDNAAEAEATKRKKRPLGGKKKLTVRLRGDANGKKSSRLQFLMRDVIYYLSLEMPSEVEKMAAGWSANIGLCSLAEVYHRFRRYALLSVAKPYQLEVRESKILVVKIHTRQKNEKTLDQLASNVAEVKESHRKIVEAKRKEAGELEKSVTDSCIESDTVITGIRRQTQNRVKRMEWKSNQRQIEMKERIGNLVKEHQELCAVHWAAEREARHRNLALESSLTDLLDTYDRDMFGLHEEIGRLEEKYAKEKEELAEVESVLAVVEAEKEEIMEERRKEEAAIRNAKMEEIRRRRAAITLQRSWRQYKVLQSQSKKKKKSKKK